MKLKLTNSNEIKNGHPPLKTLLSWLNNSKIENKWNEHIENCNFCQKEVSELFKDQQASVDAANYTLGQKLSISISKLKAGLFLQNQESNLIFSPLPMLRGEENQNILEFSQIRYIEESFIKITVSKPGSNLQIKIKALGNFSQEKNFFLYINSSLQESLTLFGRQTGEFKNIKKGHIRVLADTELILEMNIEQT